MADATPAMVPDFNSFDDDGGFSFSEAIRILDENPTLLHDIDEFPLTQHNSSFDRSEASDPLSNPVVSNNLDQAGPSEFRGETSHPQQGVLQPANSGFGNPVQPPGFWPGSSVPYSCSCCQVLREIIHTKGMHATKLEIHGRLGLIISHAILENRFADSDSTAQSQHYQMLDFSNQSLEAIKEYLVQYCEGRKQDGYTMQRDPLLEFYEALCVGLTNGDDFFQPSPADNSGREHQVNQPEAVNQTGATRDEVIRLARSSTSVAAQVTGLLFRNHQRDAQRERTRNLTVKDLKRYFHLPIEVAASQMQVCPTVMKKICRKHGLKRWPHRRIKSIEKKISSLKASLNNGNDAEEKARAQQDIESFQQELAGIFAGSNC
ncbi:hypothetical protein RHMOL_Rhmol09G0060100 [Rhododendron molle]|uniref:Uncharacterized protein n=1 Tax=Rhododendron molle TaxID=49168 RepID=A0ACC0MBE6_RHOML|nr:hypothetical protein RHMOL_Rhmol09G0060100 [Rhododendron molle]